MSDPLKGFEELAKDLELKSKLSRYTDGACAQAAEDARSIRALLAAARSEITRQKREEFVAGGDYKEQRAGYEEGLGSHDRKIFKAEAERRNP